MHATTERLEPGAEGLAGVAPGLPTPSCMVYLRVAVQQEVHNRPRGRQRGGLVACRVGEATHPGPDFAVEAFDVELSDDDTSPELQWTMHDGPGRTALEWTPTGRAKGLRGPCGGCGAGPPHGAPEPSSEWHPPGAHLECGLGAPSSGSPSRCTRMGGSSLRWCRKELTCGRSGA